MPSVPCRKDISQPREREVESHNKVFFLRSSGKDPLPGSRNSLRHNIHRGTKVRLRQVDRVEKHIGGIE